MPVQEPRLPLAPLLRCLGLQNLESDSVRARLGRVEWENGVPKQKPVSPRTVKKWGREGIKLWTADQITADAGMHPRDVWPEWDDIVAALPADDDKPARQRRSKTTTSERPADDSTLSRRHWPADTLKRMVAAGAVPDNTVWITVGKDPSGADMLVEAVIDPDGSLTVDGVKLGSPSAAARYARKISRPLPGWNLWKARTADGRLVPLAALRDQFYAARTDT